MEKILYLHDAVIKHRPESLAANKRNAISVYDIEEFICKSPGNVVISADDGYESVLNLVPLIEKYHVNCLLFVTTGFIEKSAYPYEIVVSSFLETAGSAFQLDGAEVMFANVESKERYYKKIHGVLKSLPRRKRDEEFARWQRLNNVSADKYKKDVFLNWNQIRELDSNPLVEIGSHTDNHLNLPACSIFEIYRELAISKRKIEKELGHKIKSISYPYGTHNLKIQLTCRVLGYEKGYCTTSSRFENKWSIQRVDLNNSQDGK